MYVFRESLFDYDFTEFQDFFDKRESEPSYNSDVIDLVGQPDGSFSMPRGIEGDTSL